MKWLFAFIFLFSIANANEITTGNLITNGNFETGNSNGWNTSGDVMVLNDCCELNNVESNYDLEFGDSKKWAGVVALEPPCNMFYKPRNFGTPLLVIKGGKSHYEPKPC